MLMWISSNFPPYVMFYKDIVSGIYALKCMCISVYNNKICFCHTVIPFYQNTIMHMVRTEKDK